LVTLRLPILLINIRSFIGAVLLCMSSLLSGIGEAHEATAVHHAYRRSSRMTVDFRAAWPVPFLMAKAPICAAGHILSCLDKIKKDCL
jgi:hypothetical protein